MGELEERVDLAARGQARSTGDPPTSGPASTGAAADPLAEIWRAVGGAPELPDRVSVPGPAGLLPSTYDVTGFAAATVGAATLAAAELLAARTGSSVRSVAVDRRTASAAFVSEWLFTPIGWERPAAWDPIAGNYRSRTGWVRLHTNYRYHRAVVEQLLGARDRDAVAAAVTEWDAVALQEAVVAAGRCAAAMYDRASWLSTPAGRATRAEPLARVAGRTAAPPVWPEPDRPFSGLRVLDLTRVIAGPVATRFLAAYGADVLRIDPPGFEEVGALLPETTVGKRTAQLDLSSAAR